jgi:ADP-ribose pyrophosphatase YjhB (NUDIX family)
MNNPALLNYLELVLATAQVGLTFSKNCYDIERFKKLQEVTAKLLASHTQLNVEAIKTWITLDSEYPTPKLDVRAVVFNSNQDVLLVQERSDSLWTLPGGWCDIGESPSEAIEREVLEETGLSCKAVRLLALFDKHKHSHPPQIPHAHKAFFLCKVNGGSMLQSTNETSGAQYFSQNALPILSEHRVLATQIHTLCNAVKNDIKECLFD